MQTAPVSAFAARIRSAEGDAFLTALYGEDELELQRQRYLRALAAFEARFGQREVIVLSVPGRTEICGSHTDHQQGRVLAGSITLDTLCVASPRDDLQVNLVSEGHRDTVLELEDLTPEESEQGRASALVRGVAAGIASSGIPLWGFDAYTTSRIPSGGGFSSSAAFEVLLGTLFCALGDDMLSVPELARIAQQAENVWYGKPCGLMDQYACALGGVAALDFRNLFRPEVEMIDFEFEEHGYALCAVELGASHSDLTADFAAIPAEMGMVAQRFGLRVLRFVEQEEFEEKLPLLERELPARAILRARHFFDENERVLRMAEALRQGDMDACRREMLASGESSRRLLQNIVPDSKPDELALVRALERSAELLGERGAWRVHGGGFGGSMQALLPLDMLEDYRREMDALFGSGAVKQLRIRPRGPVIF